MINSIWIGILKLNDKRDSEGQYLLAVVEFIVTAIIYAIYRNT